MFRGRYYSEPKNFEDTIAKSLLKNHCGIDIDKEGEIDKKLDELEEKYKSLLNKLEKGEYVND